MSQLARIVGSISRDAIDKHLSALIGPRDPICSPGALEAAGDYVGQCLREAGLEVVEDPFIEDGQRFRNVVGTLRGTVDPDSQVLVIAHYDTVEGTPGADDNASAVAGMLEIARVLAGVRPPRTVRFVGFTLEEYGFRGSVRFARRAAAERQRILGVLDLEMIGFTSEEQGAPPGIPAPPRGDFIAVVGNARSRALVQAYAAAAKEVVPALPVQPLVLPGNGEGLPIARLSDHSSFWDAGYPAVMITDTAFLRNPNYHLPTDDRASLDLTFLTRVTAATAATAARLAGIG